MALVLSATTYTEAKGYGNERTAVRVVTNAAEPKWLKTGFEERGNIYRAEEGDTATFFFYKEPGNGFGRAKVDITMWNGEKRTLIGPWSSNAHAVNLHFLDKDMLFSCVDQFNCVCHVKVAALERLGIRLTLNRDFYIVAHEA